MDSAVLALDARNIVGESIVWDAERGALCWVDIVGKKIFRWTPGDATSQQWQMQEIVTSIGLTRDGYAVVGFAKTVELFDFAGRFAPLATVEPDLPENRLNEGVVGPDGSLWVGTMQNNINADGSPRDITASAGSLYRVTPQGAAHRITDDLFGITNSMVWLRNGRFVTADTMQNALYSYAVDGRTGALSDRREFMSGFPRGAPDGSCMDSEGFVWNCRVGGGACLVRMDPDGGIDRIVELPCSWPTSCCFGGENLDILYVTSARFTMEDAHLAANPQEGAIFAIDVGVTGVLPYRFNIDGAAVFP